MLTVEPTAMDADLHTPDSDERAAVGEPAHPDRPTRRQLAVVVGVVFLARLLYTIGRRAPQITPDEFAVFGMGRFLAGGEWNMFGASTWRPGFSLVMVPLHLVIDDPGAIYRAALVINAAIGAASAILLVHVGRRVAALPPSTLCIVATLASVTPAALSSSALIWAEPLVTVTFLGAMLLASDGVIRRDALRSALAVWVASAGFLAHSRMLPFVLFLGVLLIVVFVRMRAWAPALAVAVSTAAGVLSVQAFSSWVFSSVYEDPGETNTVSSTLERFSAPHRVAEAALSQVWYLLVSTALLAGIGLGALAVRAFRARGTDAFVTPALFLASFVVMLGVSALFMSGRTRPDHLVYGRYNDALLGPVMIAAAGFLVAEVRRLPRDVLLRAGGFLGVITLVLGLFVLQLHGPLLDGRPVGEMVPGLLPALTFTDVIRPLLFTAPAVALGVGVIALARRGRLRELTIGTAVLLVVLGAAAWSFESGSRDGRADDRGLLSFESELRSVDAVGFAFISEEAAPDLNAITQLNAALSYQWHLDGVPFVRDVGLDDQVGPYVFAAASDVFLTASGSELLWTDPDIGAALWREAADVTSGEVVAALQACVDELGDTGGVSQELVECARLRVTKGG